MTTITERPASLEVEQALLGSCLLDAASRDAACEILVPEDFHARAHQKVFDAISVLHQKNPQLDTMLVCEELRARGYFEEIGGEPFLTRLTEMFTTCGTIAQQARLIVEKRRLRQLEELGWKVSAAATGSDAKVGRIIEAIERKLFEIGGESTQAAEQSAAQILPKVFQCLERRAKGEKLGLTTGIKVLDDFTGGLLEPGNLIIVAGRPGMGKTALSLSIAQHVAEGGNPVALFELEMSKQQVGERLLAQRSKVDLLALRQASLSVDAWKKVGGSSGEIAELPLIVDDRPSLSIAQAITRARRMKRKYKIKLIIIDYLGLMQTDKRGKSENRSQEVSEISRGLKLLAKELEIPVVALSQLNRGIEQRGEDAKPRLSDLRESGAIEQDADVVLFTHLPAKYKPELDIEKAELILAKQRNGPDGILNVKWIPYCAKFCDAEK